MCALEKDAGVIRRYPAILIRTLSVALVIFKQCIILLIKKASHILFHSLVSQYSRTLLCGTIKLILYCSYNTILQVYVPITIINPLFIYTITCCSAINILRITPCTFSYFICCHPHQRISLLYFF